jgi:hypothetical protein
MKMPTRVPEPTPGEVAEQKETKRHADPAVLPLSEKPREAPGGTGGRASLKERKDPVVRDSDESFPASDPPSY